MRIIEDGSGDGKSIRESPAEVFSRIKSKRASEAWPGAEKVAKPQRSQDGSITISSICTTSLKKIGDKSQRCRSRISSFGVVKLLLLLAIVATVIILIFPPYLVDHNGFSRVYVGNHSLIAPPYAQAYIDPVRTSIRIALLWMFVVAIPSLLMGKRR